MDVIETSRKRSAEEVGHETDDGNRGGAQPDPGSMGDENMHEAMRDAGALGADAAALAEACSPARFQGRAGAFGLSACVAMDLRLGWDVGLVADKVKAQKKLSMEQPHLLMLSPMCLDCSQLQALKTKPDRTAEMLKQSKHHLEFACNLARPESERGGDKCLFELISVKATRFMTNDEYIAEAVDSRCFGGYNQIQLLNGRAKACEKYLPRTAAMILRSLRQSMRAEGCGEAQRLMGRSWHPTRKRPFSNRENFQIRHSKNIFAPTQKTFLVPHSKNLYYIVGWLVRWLVGV